MCGLAIEIVRKGPLAPGRLAEALGLLGHRGPDAAGLETVQLDPDGPAVGLAHARLSIVDLDPRSHQPFGRDGLRLVYNGEIYNHADLSRDMALATTGDTEVLFNLLAREGPAALARCNGMWAFGLLDTARRRLVAGRDRYGKKPLFWTGDAERILLASEMGALAALSGARPAARMAEIDRFVAGGWLMPCPSGATHVEGVREVRPGHALEIDLADWRWGERQVVDLDCGDPAAPPDDDGLPGLLADAVRLRLLGERRIGLMLSGGVDSTLILAVLAARGWLDGVTCMTGEAGKSEDAAYARACAAAVGARAVALPLDYGEAGLDLFLDVCRAQEKPFPLIGNALGLHALYRAVAEAGVTVALDGAGADEIFGGYWPRQSGFALRAALAAGDGEWVARARAGGRLPERFARLGREAPPEAFAPAAEGLGEACVARLRPEARARLAAAAAADPLVAHAGTLHEALRRDATEGRMQEWLWQNDRNAMAHGVENRSPFLDYRLAPWMAQPYAAKFDGAFNKPALRALFGLFRPMPSAARADKQGFRWVYSRFMRRNHAALLELIAASRIVSRYVGPGPYLDAARAEPEILLQPLAHRLIALAGLEAVGKLTDAS